MRVARARRDALAGNLHYVIDNSIIVNVMRREEITCDPCETSSAQLREFGDF